MTVNVVCPWLPAFVLDNPADPIAPVAPTRFVWRQELQFHQETINCWRRYSQVAAVTEREWRMESTGVFRWVHRLRPSLA